MPVWGNRLRWCLVKRKEDEKMCKARGDEGQQQTGC